jgi:hypothetical protein
MPNTYLFIQNNLAFIHNLETQIVQLSYIIMERTQGTLSSKNVTNPKEHVKANIIEKWEDN